MKLIRYAYPRSSRANAFDRLFELGSSNFGRFDSFFDDFLGAKSNSYQPPVDLYEDGDNFYAKAELPGVKKNHVDLQLENSVLTIQSAESRKVKDGETKTAFVRSLSIPEGVATGKVSAQFKNGILTVTMPKEEVRKPRKIAIK
ncbi:MAG: Hsp20/alpha crystallin family protein [Verrucomicrobiota bacterium]